MSTIFEVYCLFPDKNLMPGTVGATLADTVTGIELWKKSYFLAFYFVLSF